MFRRLLGTLAPAPGGDAGRAEGDDGGRVRRGRTGGPSAAADTEAVRRIVARLEALPPDRARFLAGFAYVMSRAAQADLEITDEETAMMEAGLVREGGLDDAQAILVAEMAKVEARRFGATQDYLVTREFARIATLEEKRAALHGCFAVAAASGSISAEEASVVNEIARELDVEARTLNEVRAEFVDRLSAIQAQRRLMSQG
jgi:tellurite resistance protein